MTFQTQFELKAKTAYDKFVEARKKRPFLQSIREMPINAFYVLICVPIFTVSYSSSNISIASSSSTFDPVRNVPRMIQYVGAAVVWTFLADLLSGIVHIILDHTHLDMVDREDRSFLQRAAWGFQIHHVVQHNWENEDVFKSGILYTGTGSSLVGWMLVGLVTLLDCSPPHRMGALWCTLLVLHVQVFHVASHGSFRKTYPRLQNCYDYLSHWGLVLDRQSHHKHHTKFDCNFALITGWSNVFLNYIMQLDYVQQNWIPKSMSAETQVRVYIQEKKKIVPYLSIFPEWREFSN